MNCSQCLEFTSKNFQENLKNLDLNHFFRHTKDINLLKILKMKKLIFVLVASLLISCLPMTGSPMTAFIVKNTSDKPISFTASVIKMSQIMGPQEITNSFTVKPHDSIIARQTYFKKDGENPQKWFEKFDIFPVDGIEMNNPNLPQNWKKSSKDNIPIYTFTLNKEK